jgi:molybdate/tungstate transport system substrate-binding protein
MNIASGGQGRFLKKLPLDPAKTFDKPLRGCLLFIVLFLMLFSVSCGNNNTGNDIIIFYAPCFSPVMDEIRTEVEKKLHLKIRGEVSGSQVVCRKVSELGRECDIMMSADQTLFKKITSSYTSWRLDFSHDEVVLGVGIRAKRVDEAEKNWPPVLLAQETILGRVNENLGPIGYRTLLCWKLKEEKGFPGLMEKLKAKAEKVVDHVGHLAALLKTGDIHYGFLYRTTCIKYDIRFISLDSTINLGSHDVDYSGIQIRLYNPGDQKQPYLTVTGAPVTYSLTIPVNAPNKKQAILFINWLLANKAPLFKEQGFRFFKPFFYGPKQDYLPFKNLADYKGVFQ